MRGAFVQVDEWLYDLGSNRFRRLLRFENGRLVDIETRAKPDHAVATLRQRRPRSAAWSSSLVDDR